MRRQLCVHLHINTTGGGVTFVLRNQTSMKTSERTTTKSLSSVISRNNNTVTLLAACTGSHLTWGKWMNNALHLITSWVLMIKQTRNSMSVWWLICIFYGETRHECFQPPTFSIQTHSIISSVQNFKQGCFLWLAAAGAKNRSECVKLVCKDGTKETWGTVMDLDDGVISQGYELIHCRSDSWAEGLNHLFTPTWTASLLQYHQIIIIIGFTTGENIVLITKVLKPLAVIYR